MTDDPVERPAAPPPPWSPSPSPSSAPPYAAPPGWQPQQPPYAAPPGWQPQPPPYAAPPGWQPQPYGAAPPYGAGPGYQPYGYPQPGTTNGFAIASLACAIVVGIVPFVGGILGVTFGIIGVRQCARLGERGRGLAIAGIVVGAVAIVFWILAIIGLAVGSTSTSGTSNFGAVLW